MEQQGAAGVGKRQVAEFVKDDRVQMNQGFGEVAGLALLFFLFQLVDQVNGVVEANPFAEVDGGDA